MSKQQERLQAWEQECKGWQATAETRLERIAKLESILRDIVAWSDGFVTSPKLEEAKRLLKIAPFDK